MTAPYNIGDRIRATHRKSGDVHEGFVESVEPDAVYTHTNGFGCGGTWLIEVIEKAKPALPTEPGLYVSAAEWERGLSPLVPRIFVLRDEVWLDTFNDWLETGPVDLPVDLVPLAPRVEPTPLEVTDELVLTALNMTVPEGRGSNDPDEWGAGSMRRMRQTIEAVFAAVAKGGA